MLLASSSWILIPVLMFTFALADNMAQAQTKTTPSPTPTSQRAPAQQTRQQPPRQTGFDLSEAGVQIRPEPRLIVVMAALDAAGFDPTPAGEAPSDFRLQVHKDQASLDPDLRKRLGNFYEHHKLRGTDGKELPPAEQAARYVSLAYALGPAPNFDEPPRSDDLPAALLDVLDFAPLVREFYHKSGMDARMSSYIAAYQAEGNRLRASTVEMVRSVLSYLNTRPITTTIERIIVTSPNSDDKRKKNEPKQKIETREHDRHFFVVPDLLAAPGAINFRVIADDYFVTAPYCNEAKYICAGRDNNPPSPELRRAYINYVVDPLVVRFNREIAARREQIKQLLDSRKSAGTELSPDVFLAVARSLAAAADVRLEETTRLDALSREARARLDQTTDPTKRAAIVKELETGRAAVADEAIARLAESYESGAVLDFYFAEQLRGVESSGFDISNSLADMIASFDPAREARRLEENDAARKRALAARKEREAQAQMASTAAALPKSPLVQQLLDVDSLMQANNYQAAEERLLALLRQYPEEPRIFFALGKVASRSARGVFDEDLLNTRLNKALNHYRNAVNHATPDTDRCLVASAHEAMGSIYKFMERKDEALKEFDAAIEINDTSCAAYAQAVEEKKTLSQPK
jgi:tetratricopeptide (TPR) repeat protein